MFPLPSIEDQTLAHPLVPKFLNSLPIWNMCCKLERVNEDNSGAAQVDSNEPEGHTR